MFEKKPMKSELAAAEELLSRRAKLNQAIAREVEKLPALIDARAAAESELAKIEVRAAIGEATAEAVAKARAKAETARAATDAIAAKLRPLRGGLMDFGGSLAEQHARVSAAMSPYNQALETDFQAKWTEAIAGYERILGQRQAIEALTGHKLDLPAPTPKPADLGQAARPHQVLTELAEGIQAAAADARIATEVPRPDPHGNLSTFDPQAIYLLRRKFGAFEEGAKVLNCSFEPGRLRSLVASDWARSLASIEQGQRALDAKIAARKLQEDAAAVDEGKRRATEAALQATMTAEEQARNPRLRWDDSMARRDVEGMSPQDRAEYRRRHGTLSGPATEVAQGPKEIETLIGG